MSQDQWIILLFKIVLVANELALLAFIALYSKWAPWWRNPIGRTIVIIAGLLGAALLVSVLSLFFHFNRLTSHVAAWVDLAIFAGIAVEMVHRCFIWQQIRHKPGGEHGGP